MRGKRPVFPSGDAALRRHFALALDMDEIADLHRRRALHAHGRALHEICGKRLFESPRYLDLEIRVAFSDKQLCRRLAAVDVAEKSLGHDNSAVKVGVAKWHEPREEICDTSFKRRRYGGHGMAFDGDRRVGDAALRRHFFAELSIPSIPICFRYWYVPL